MRILMGIPFLYPAISYGGAARSAYELAAALQSLGHEVTVITTDVWDSHSRYRSNGFDAPFEIIRVPNLSNTVAYHFQFYTPLGVLKHTEKLLSSCEILHLHTFRNLLNDLLARAAVKQKVPYVLTGHGTIPRIERFFMIKKVYDFLIGQWQLKHAAGFIALSKAERKRMKQFGLPSEKIRIIPNGIRKPPLPDSNLFRRRWGIHPEEKVILFLGRITRLKGLQYLIPAFARIRNEARLVIAGNDMGYGDRIRSMISEYRLENRVIWTGLLDDVQKFQALRAADLTVYPSVNEAFGFVPLESILSGTPVIVCSNDGCGEIIRKIRAGGLVPQGDVAALTDTMKRFLHEGKDSFELGRARKQIMRRFDWTIIAERVLNLYRSILLSEMKRNKSFRGEESESSAGV